MNLKLWLLETEPVQAKFPDLLHILEIGLIREHKPDTSLVRSTHPVLHAAPTRFIHAPRRTEVEVATVEANLLHLAEHSEGDHIRHAVLEIPALKLFDNLSERVFVAPIFTVERNLRNAARAKRLVQLRVEVQPHLLFLRVHSIVLRQRLTQRYDFLRLHSRHSGLRVH